MHYPSYYMKTNSGQFRYKCGGLRFGSTAAYVESIANNVFDKFEQIDRETNSKEAKLIAYFMARHSSWRGIRH